jgi:hypothetical protein
VTAVLEMRKGLLVPAHPEVAASLRELTLVRLAKGTVADAEASIREYLIILEKADVKPLTLASTRAIAGEVYLISETPELFQSLTIARSWI